MKKGIKQRRCVGCGNSYDKDTLIRIVRNKAGECSIDYKGNAQGRGAYLCKNPACIEAAIKRGGLARSYRCSVPKDFSARLQEELL